MGNYSAGTPKGGRIAANVAAKKKNIAKQRSDISRPQTSAVLEIWTKSREMLLRRGAATATRGFGCFGRMISLVASTVSEHLHDVPPAPRPFVQPHVVSLQTLPIVSRLRKCKCNRIKVLVGSLRMRIKIGLSALRTVPPCRISCYDRLPLPCFLFLNPLVFSSLPWRIRRVSNGEMGSVRLSPAALSPFGYSPSDCNGSRERLRADPAELLSLTPNFPVMKGRFRRRPALDAAAGTSTRRSIFAFEILQPSSFFPSRLFGIFSMTRLSLFLWTLQLSTSVLAATGSVYVTDLPAFSGLAPCAASAISYVVQGLTASKCPPGVTELVSCACTKDANSAAISGSITSSVKYSCASTASEDITSALSVFAGYCNQGAVTAAPTSTAAAAGVTAFITDLDQFNDLPGCARSGLSYAVQSLTRYQCPSDAAQLQSCACTKNQNSLAASGSINSQISAYCGSTHTADVSSAQAVFAGYCGLGAGTSAFPSPSYLPGKVTYYITDLPQYSSLAPCAKSGVSYELGSWSRSLCGTAPLAMVSCACVQDNNSGAVNSGIKSSVLAYCASTATADVTSALAVFDYYCSAGKGLVTPLGVTASVTATGTGVRTTTKATGAGATATGASAGTGSSSSSSSSSTTKVPITAIIGAAVGAIVLLIIALFFIFRWRRSSKIRAAQQANAQAMMMPPPQNMANMGGPPPMYPETPAPMTPMTPMAQPVLLKPAAVVDNRPVSPLEEKNHSFVSDPNRVEMETPPAPNRAELSPHNEVIMANRAELHSQSGSRVNSPQIPHAGPHNVPLPQQNGQPIQELGQNPGLYGQQYNANGQPVQELPQGGQYGQQYGANGQPLQELPQGQYQQQPQHPWGAQQPGQGQYGQQQQMPIEMQVPATSPRPGMGTMAGPVPVYEMQGGGSWPQQQQQPPR